MHAALLLLTCLACVSQGQKRGQFFRGCNQENYCKSLEVVAELNHIPSSLKVLSSLLMAFIPASGRVLLRNVGAVAWPASATSLSPAGLGHPLLAPARHVDLSMLQGEVLDFDKVVKALKTHTPDILHREPNWNMFAENFRVYDQNGAELKGLKSNKVSLDMLRRKCEELSVEDDISVDFTLHDEFSKARRFPFIEACWNVRLQIPGDSPLDIEARTVFHLNDRNQADFLRIDKWLANGQPAAHFEGWTKDVEEFQLLNPSALESIQEIYSAHVDKHEVGSGVKVTNITSILDPPKVLPSQRAELLKLIEEAETQTKSNVTVLDDLPLPGYQGPLLLFTDDLCLGHDTGTDHPESSARLEGLIRSIRNDWSAEFGESRLQIWEPSAGVSPDVTEEQLLRVHSQTHVEKMKLYFQMAENNDQFLDDGSTIVSQGSQAAALRAAGLVVAAVDAVLQPSAASSRAFVAVRPPGHHAERDAAMGFCLFNNIMVGVAHAEAVHGKRRVAIVDFDVHHGNGNEDIVRGHASRFVASSHQSPLYPDTGLAPGRFGDHKEILNVPLLPDCGPEGFRRAWNQTILPAVVEFDPDIVFISAGFDAHAHDPLASLDLREDDFKWVTESILRAARGVPVVSVLEGGYNVGALERSVRSHMEALASEKT